MLRSDLLIALHLHQSVDYDDILGLDCDQAVGDKGSFIVPFKCEVILAGATVTEDCAGTTSTPVLDFEKRPTAGSDVGRGSADIAHLVLGTTQAGKVIYDEAAIGQVLYPGEEVMAKLTTAAVGTPTGHVRPFLLVASLPEVKANLLNMVKTA